MTKVTGEHNEGRNSVRTEQQWLGVRVTQHQLRHIVREGVDAPDRDVCGEARRSSQTEGGDQLGTVVNRYPESRTDLSGRSVIRDPSEKTRREMGSLRLLMAS